MSPDLMAMDALTGWYGFIARLDPAGVVFAGLCVLIGIVSFIAWSASR